MKSTLSFLLFIIICCCSNAQSALFQSGKQIMYQPVDYVNPYIGNISHLLVPTFPTIHLPNSLLRVYPERGDYTGDLLKGLPLIVTSHRGSSAFSLSPYQGDPAAIKPIIFFTYENEIVKPYYYEVRLDEAGTENPAFALFLLMMILLKSSSEILCKPT